jgi:hypothetical protein
MFEISQLKIQQATLALFGQPLPFVTVYTTLLQPTVQVQSILAEAPYELFQTQAVYRQDDPNPIPQIGLLHWLRVKDIGQAPSKPKSLDVVAQEMGGRLMFSQQVPVESTTIRPMPDIPIDAVTDLLRTIPMPGVIPPIPLPGGPLPFPIPGVPPGTPIQLPFPVPSVPPGIQLPFPVPSVPPRNQFPFPIPDRFLPFEEPKRTNMVVPLLVGVGLAFVLFKAGEALAVRR